MFKPKLKMDNRASGSRNTPVYSMSFNPAEHAVLVCTRASNLENSTYDLYQLPKGDDDSSDSQPDPKRSSGLTAVWVARNRYYSFSNTHDVVEKKVSH